MKTDDNLYQNDMETDTIFDKVEKYLSKKYNLRYNEIALEFEIRTENGEWTELNLNSLYIELNKAGKKITINKLEIFMRSHLIPAYNPFVEFFNNIEKWDGKNHIQQLSSFVKTNDDVFFHKHFEKWLARTVICALKKGYVNKQCLILFNTKQNSGKTTFLRFLVPPALERYYTEEISLDKDGIIALCKNFIGNFDELRLTSKADVNETKIYYFESNC